MKTAQLPQMQSRPGWQQFAPHSSDGGGGGQQPRFVGQNAIAPLAVGFCSLMQRPAQHSSPLPQHSLSSLGSSSTGGGRTIGQPVPRSELLQQPSSTAAQRVNGSSLSGMQPVPQQVVPVMQQSSLHFPSAHARARTVAYFRQSDTRVSAARQHPISLID